MYTMESYTNYPYTKLETAKANGYEIVMTPRLDADVSVRQTYTSSSCASSQQPPAGPSTP